MGMIDPAEVISAAQAWYSAGFCVVPPRMDGTKGPISQWKDYQATRPDSGQMGQWYDRGQQHGVGLLCGRVSGNLEMLELEGRVTNDPAFMEQIERELGDRGLTDPWEALCDGYSEWTPSGGLHLLYRVQGHPVPGNTKIACRPKDPADYTDKDRETLARSPRAVIMETLIETRGEGGYVIVAPSQGSVHPSGNPWTLGHLSQPGVVPAITWEQREALVAALSVFDVPKPRPEPPARPAPRPLLGSVLRVGDDFNARGTWDFLADHGWTISHTAGQETFWVRPGKDRRDGHSASTGYAGDADRLYVWSSATVFPTEEPISRFAAYTELEYNGDYRAATKALAAQGYGEQRKPAAILGYQQSGDFVPTLPGYEPDEPVGEVKAAFDAGTPGVTAPPRRNYCQTSVGNAERMVDMFAKDFRYVPIKGDPHWMAWDGVRWREDHGDGLVNSANVAMTYVIKDEADQMFAAQPEGDDLKAARAHRKWFQSSQMAGGMNGTLSQFAKSPQVIAKPGSFDQILGYLNLPNGIFNLQTGQLGPHDRKMMFTNLFGTHYDPAAQAPKFRQFMETVVPDPQMRKFLQRAIGYSLTGKPDQRAMMILWGLRRTGKSQFIELMQAMFGDYGYTAMAGAFHKVDKRGDAATPGQHSLMGKRFVSISETDEDAVLDETALKRFTGTDSVSTRALYRKDENWKPQCVIWIVTNNKPLLSPDDTAVWDRVKLAHFPTQFSARGSDTTLKEIPDYASLLFAEEAPGIFNWALEGLKEFQELGGLAEPEQVTENAEAYRREVDPVSQFWDENIEEGKLGEDSESKVDAKILYRAYTLWCEENRMKGVVGPRRFQARLRSRLGLSSLPRSNSVTWVPGWKWTGSNWLIGVMGGGSS
jgi:P4 family phage/plasmid primase-like protien